MSRRGWNLKRGTPERAASDARLRAKRKALLEPEPIVVEANGGENPDLHPTPAEKAQAELVLREARRAFWRTPLVAVLNGKYEFAARPLPDSMILPWEDIDEVSEREMPGYAGWRLEDSPAGL